ncbi:lipopolysaccharide transport periplasmic protein LptA [Desulfovermiculus halophilus]|uniref:lipopolysaccharide transport periplasmic protein LptA n=1 Tax=Desulfovermiculus halophilus TaxID=339722 RepID=UPI000480D1F3|nr:lipopolysaccharide transport periplasmic protein LptA [Desulfovermiculus halophilus]
MLVVICTAALVSSAAAQSAGLTESKPMNIEADRVTYGQDENRLEFEGDVYVQRPDFELWCDRMIVTLHSEENDAQQESSQEMGLATSGRVRRIVAQDNVRLKMEQRTATSDRAEFYVQESRIVLLHNVVLQEQQNTVQGHKVTFWLDEDRSVIESKEGSRVKAVFYPDEEEDSE